MPRKTHTIRGGRLRKRLFKTMLLETNILQISYFGHRNKTGNHNMICFVNYFIKTLGKNECIRDTDNQSKCACKRGLVFSNKKLFEAFYKKFVHKS